MVKKNTVGYGRPPTKTQFKKGQSGNPNGRPKGSKNLDQAMEAELQTKVIVREGGKEIVLTRGEVVTKAVVAKAMKGDIPAVKTVLDYVERKNAKEQPPISWAELAKSRFDDNDET